MQIEMLLSSDEVKGVTVRNEWQTTIGYRTRFLSQPFILHHVRRFRHHTLQPRLKPCVHFSSSYDQAYVSLDIPGFTSSRNITLQYQHP